MLTGRSLRGTLIQAGIASALALAPAALAAQTGRISGTITERGGAPIADAQVLVVGTGASAISGGQGAYAIANVPAGTHEVRVLRLGFRSTTVPNVVVRDGEQTTVDVALDEAATALSAVVISASRRAERVQDAPATITRIETAAIENSVGNSFSGALKEVKGLDYIQIGVTSAAINARGFNSSFNNRMLMMEDGRIAVLPENGLPVGQFTSIPKVDLAGVEVIVGPGAALYGADASNGVLTLQTKDPRDFPGTTIEIAGGSRDYRDIQMRHAGVAGSFGYKLAGEYMEALDFENYLQYAGGVQEVGIDWHSDVTRGEGALVWYGSDSRLEASAGWSRSNGVGQTNVGRNQLVDWTYDHQQIKWASPSWFLNAYRTHSNAGDSYAINRYSSFKVGFPAESHDELVARSDWPSDGQLYAAEAQNNFRIGALNGTRVVWGGQYRHDIVSSEREWLTDRLTGEDLTISQYGGYAQSETPLAERFTLLLAGRYDEHENYDGQFSPKAGVIFKPSDDRSVRLTWNQAFKSPSTLQTNFYIPAFAAWFGVYGNRNGFTIRDAGGATIQTITPLEPEKNRTWELGYKGPLAGDLSIDVTGYHASYDNFLGSLLGINNASPLIAAAERTYAFDHEGNRLEDEAGTPQTALTYQNLGNATIYGTDLGLEYLLSRRFRMSGTLSWLKVSDIENPSSNDSEATALNSPTLKWALGANGTDIVGRLLGGFTVRHVTGYMFNSGINDGRIPTFTTLDLNLGYPLPEFGTFGSAQVNLSVGNLFTCRGKFDGTPMGQSPSDKGCGFGEKHPEMVNMPEIGTIVFLGLRYHRQ